MIECGELRSVKLFEKDGVLYMYKLSVVEKRNALECKNYRDSDAWNVTVLNQFLLSEVKKYKVGDKLKVIGRAESKCVNQDKWFTEIIANDIVRYGGGV